VESEDTKAREWMFDSCRGLLWCHAGISVYNVVVLCLIGVPTSFMIKEQIDAVYTLTSLFTFFATTLTICLVFIPKVSQLLLKVK